MRSWDVVLPGHLKTIGQLRLKGWTKIRMGVKRGLVCVSIVLGDEERLSGGWGDQHGVRVKSGPELSLVLTVHPSMTSVPLSSTGGAWPLRPSWSPRIPWGPWSTGKRFPQDISFCGG